MASPQWSAAESWEKAKNLPVGSFRNLSKLKNGVLYKIVSGAFDVESGSKELLKEMKEVGLDTSQIGKPSEIHECLSGILESVRVNGDIRDMIQCLRFDGIQTFLLSHTRKREGRDANMVKDEMAVLNKEMIRHFNATFQYSDQQFKKDPQIFHEIFNVIMLKTVAPLVTDLQLSRNSLCIRRRWSS